MPEDIAPDTVTIDTLAAGAGDRPMPHRYAEGKRIGRYSILEPLAAGGMGEVYRAFDPDLQRPVALKLLRIATKAKPEKRARLRERLVREAQGMAKLSHPNVVAVYDVGVVEDEVFIAMELVDGMPLNDWLSFDREWQEILKVFIAAGEGLAAAHRKGLVHRDFKPANVLVGADNRVRVADFGLVRMTDGQPEQVLTPAPDMAPAAIVPSSRDDISVSTGEATLSSDRLSLRMTRQDVVLGTPRYMSPEQHRKRPADARSDQFSFCVALYEALYDQRPFEASTLGVLRAKVCAGEIADPPSRTHVPKRIARILYRGLAVKPGERYPSMNALLGELRFDARARAIRWGVGVGFAALAGLAVYGLARDPDETAAAAITCTDGQARIESVWNDSSRDGLSAAFAKLELSYGAGARQRATSALDAYRDRWATAHDDVCAATHLRHERSEMLFDRGMVCLEHARAQLKGVVVALLGGERDVLDKAAPLIEGLPHLASCQDAAVLVDNADPPPARSAKAVSIATEAVSRARAMTLAAKYAEARTLLSEQRRAAEELDYRPLQAEILNGIARLEIAARNGGKAEQLAREAARTALEGGAMWAWRQALVTRAEAALVAKDTSGAVELALDARAALARYPAARRNRASLARILGQTAQAKGDYVAAAEHARRGLAILPETSSPGERARLLLVLGEAQDNLGQHADAAQSFERSVALVRGLHGPGHPDLAGVWEKIGNLEYHAGNLKAARRAYEASASITNAAFGEGHVRNIAALANLGMVLGDMGDHEAELEAYDRTLSVLAALNQSDGIQAATITHNKGMAFWQLGRMRESVAMLEASLEQRLRHWPPTHPELASHLVHLAVASSDAGDDKSANDYAKRALQVGDAQPGKSLPRSWAYSMAGHVWLRQRRWTAAERAFEKGREELAAIAGEKSEWLTVALSGLGQVALHRGDVDSAIKLLADAYQRRKAVPQMAADTEIAYARALARRPAERERSLTIARSAVSRYQALPHKAAHLARAQAWIRSQKP